MNSLLCAKASDIGYFGAFYVKERCGICKLECDAAAQVIKGCVSFCFVLSWKNVWFFDTYEFGIFVHILFLLFSWKHDMGEDDVALCKPGDMIFVSAIN